jgi:phospholipid/cholesterol/gamma-HCH transport system substrate-binding protein
MRTRAVSIGVIVALLLVAGFVFFRPERNAHLTAYFTQTRGIYKGDKVTVLGVAVGRITNITPERDRVRVEMEIRKDVALPEDVKAAITSPALVTVRTIALGPAYDGGPRLAQDAVIPLSRTVVPVEWDEVKNQLTQLTAALGPDGVNKDGSVSHLVTSSAGYLKGQGATLNQTIKDLSAAMTTLADNKGHLFATVRNLQVFVAALEGSDQQVALFNERLASVSAALAGDRTALSRSLAGLRVAFAGLQDFLRKNNDLTASTLNELRSTTSVLADSRQRLADLLQVAPTTVSNFYNIMDPRNGAQTGVLAFQNFNAPAHIICAALLNLNGKPQQCIDALQPLVKYLSVDAPPTGVLPGLGLPSKTSSVTRPGTGDDLLDGLAQLMGGAK